MKLDKRNKARELRYQGFSMKQISLLLSVSKGSVSTWVRDIEIPSGVLKNIKDQRQQGRERSRKTRLSNLVSRNIELSIKCKKEILPFSDRDMWIAGLMLYAGEGRKTLVVSSQRIELVNSDPNILRIFINFLIHVCAIPKEKIKIRLILYRDIDIKEAENYWSTELNIPLVQFQKSFVKQSYKTLQHRYLRRSNYGTAHINVYDVLAYRKIMGWLQAIYEYNNLDF